MTKKLYEVTHYLVLSSTGLVYAENADDAKEIAEKICRRRKESLDNLAYRVTGSSYDVNEARHPELADSRLVWNPEDKSSQ